MPVLAIQPGTKQEITVPLGSRVSFEWYTTGSFPNETKAEIGAGLEKVVDAEIISTPGPLIMGGSTTVRDTYVVQKRGSWIFKYVMTAYSDKVEVLVDTKINVR